jgi:hypothetical protein
MATFDQRGQKVNFQYNAAGDINFIGVEKRSEALAQLKKLRDEVQKADQAGALDSKVAVEVEAKLQKAALEGEKPEAKKKSMLTYLSEAKALLEGISSATAIVTALTQAIEMVKKLF